MLGGGGEDLAARREQRSLAARGYCGRLDIARHVLVMRLERGPVRHHSDFHLMILVRLQVQQVKPARVLEDDVPRPNARAMHVELLEERHLPEPVMFKSEER